ncbi:alanine racemase [Desulfovibrio sp. OttesenSCG-928-O18]|nr:alanine racemase [Desulfovibrio sp. OttesenSCG-928-O18]
MIFSPPREAAATGFPYARIDLGALRRNWRYLASLSADVPPMAVVKADAYGHGILETARVFLEEGCRFFATGTVAEGVFLRQELTALGASNVTILPLLGIMDEKDAAVSFEADLVPLIHSAWQAALVARAYSGSAPLPVAVKIETGMSRLGFRPEDTGELLTALREAGNLAPTLLLSHLAAADDPTQDASVAAQVAFFLEAYAALRSFWPEIGISLANSAAYLAKDTLLSALPRHTGRPGYALYGGNPFAGTSREPLGRALEPAMAVVAPVLGVHDLAAGRTVSYGRTFTAPAAMRVAVVGAGYADGFSRGLSGKGHVCIRGARCPVLGRVCMQMHVADVTHVPEAQAGDEAYLLGGTGEGRIGMEDLAREWGTIPYEIFCILGGNRRVYSGRP